MTPKANKRNQGVFLTSFFLIFIFSLVCVNAISTYEQSGITPQSDYNAEDGQFNEDLSVSTQSRPITNNREFSLPKVADLDGDGVNEIIALDGSTLRIYQDSSLEVITSKSSAKTILSDFQIYDIDGDSLLDIIYLASQSTSTYSLRTMEFNGTDLNENELFITGLTHSATGGTYAGVHGIIKCDDGVCGLAYISERACATAGAFLNSLAISMYAVVFTNNTLSNALVIESNSDCSGDWSYFPLMPVLAIDDIDKDGNNDIMFTRVHGGYSETKTAKLNIVNYNSSYYLSSKSDTTLGSYGADSIGLITALPVWYQRSHVTSPMIMEADGQNDGLEIVIGMHDTTQSLDQSPTGKNDFQVKTYGKTVNYIDVHPNTNLEGKYMSNPFKYVCVEGKTDDDFGIVVYSVDTETGDDNKELILCGSEKNQYGVYETITFEIDSSPFNISNNDINGVVHSSNMDGDSLDEIITSYGVYKLEYTGCGFTATCESTKIFSVPDTTSTNNNAFIVADVQNNGEVDLIGMGTNNLLYYDDGFINSNAKIDGWNVNPCIDRSIGKINETLRVSITGLDPDDDDVQLRAILYYGESNEQDTNWSADFNSGYPFTLPDFILNETTSDSTLLLMVRDNQHETTGDTIEVTFRVGENGVEFNDCIGGYDNLVSENESSEDVDLTPTNLDDNAIRTFTETFANQTGLGEELIFLIVLLILVGGVWFIEGIPSDSKLYASVMLGIITIIIGFFTGLIGFGVILTIVVCALVIIGIWIRKMFSAGG